MIMMRIITIQARACPTERRPPAGSAAGAVAASEAGPVVEMVLMVVPPQARSVSPARVIRYWRIVMAASTMSSPTAIAEA